MDVTTQVPGPVYRPGRPTTRDYAEACADIAAAMTQLGPDGRNCAVCHDSGHQAWECHHNPLVMARRAVAAAAVWRCYHCGVVCATHDEAEAHFGRGEDEEPACRRPGAERAVPDPRGEAVVALCRDFVRRHAVSGPDEVWRLGADARHELVEQVLALVGYDGQVGQSEPSAGRETLRTGPLSEPPTPRRGGVS